MASTGLPVVTTITMNAKAEAITIPQTADHRYTLWFARCAHGNPAVCLAERSASGVLALVANSVTYASQES